MDITSSNLSPESVEFLAGAAKHLGTVKIVMAAALLPLSFLGFVFFDKRATKSFEERLTALTMFYGVLSFVMFSFVIFHVSTLLKAWIAPEVFLMEQMAVIQKEIKSAAGEK